MKKALLGIAAIALILLFPLKIMTVTIVSSIVLILLAAMTYIDFAEEKKLAALSKSVKEISDGKYSLKLKTTDYNGGLREIADSIVSLKNKLIQYIFEMQVAANQITAVSQELAANLDESNAFSQQLYAEAQEMSELNNESHSSLDSTMNEIKNIAGLLESVKNTTYQIEHTGTESKQIIHKSLSEIMQIVDAVNNIQRSTDTTVRHIEKLNLASSEIAQILQTVDNIAKQTHLLSLNASIESARAGELGKGFGIVAEEIRKLSEDSKSAVSNIGLLVEKITSEISNVTQCIHHNLENVNRSVQCSETIGGSLNKIQSSYDNVQSMIRNIVSSAEDQFVMATNIRDKITDMENISTEVSEGFSVIYDSIGKQKENIEEIGGLSQSLASSSECLNILTEKADIDLVEDNLSKFNNVSQNIMNLIREEISSSIDIQTLDSRIHKNVLDKLLEKHSFVEAIWTNDRKGKFIYSNPPAGIANAKVRDWFKESMKGNEYTSSVYISAITKNPCITVSLPIKNSSGNLIGVIGADLKMKV